MPYPFTAARRLGSVALLSALAVTALGATSASARAATPTLSVTASTPRVAKGGRSATVTVRVGNAGKGTLAHPKLTVSPAKGITATIEGAPKRTPHGRTLRALKAHGHIRVTVRLRATAKHPKPATTRVRVSSGKLHASASVGFPAKPTTNGPATGDPSSLAGRYFWRSQFLPFRGLQVDPYYFANAHFAYHGTPEGKLPDCPAATAQGSDDGCVPYTYDAATGAITVGSESGRLPKGTTDLVLGERGYSELAVPAAGATFAGGGTTASQSGSCPTSCAYAQSDLAFTADGQFAAMSFASGTLPDGGGFAALPPDQHGSYAIVSRGVIRMTYADGTVVTRSIGYLPNAQDEPDPAGAGVVLDGLGYVHLSD